MLYFSKIPNIGLWATTDVARMRVMILDENTSTDKWRYHHIKLHVG